MKTAFKAILFLSLTASANLSQAGICSDLLTKAKNFIISFGRGRAAIPQESPKADAAQSEETPILVPNPDVSKSPYLHLLESNTALVPDGRQLGLLIADGKEGAHAGTINGSEFAIMTDRGALYKYGDRVNEDVIGIGLNPMGDFFLMISDGMGGPKSGDVASSSILRTFMRDILWLMHDVGGTVVNAFRDLKAAYEAKSAAGESPSKDLGATYISAKFDTGMFQISHMGDPRALVFRDGEIVFETRDHSLVQNLGLTEEKAFVSDQGHVVTRAIDLDQGEIAVIDETAPVDPMDIFERHLKATPEIEDFRPQKGDILVLVSDGADILFRNAIRHYVKTELAAAPSRPRQNLAARLLIRMRQAVTEGLAILVAQDPKNKYHDDNIAIGIVVY